LLNSHATQQCCVSYSGLLEFEPILFFGTINLKSRHQRTLGLIFTHPVPGSIQWSEVLALLRVLGAEITEREGSRVAIFLFGEIKIMHRPHPSNTVDKGAVASLRKWFEANDLST